MGYFADAPSVTPSPASPDRPHWGPVKWEALHRRALAFSGKGSDVPVEQQWLKRWLDTLVSCGGCRDHARQWVVSHPPDLVSPAAYFAWTVAFHNAVNARLGKTVVSVESALGGWQKKVPIQSASSGPL